ncbi:unnamed protein product, partial [Linum tenue]
RNPQPISLLQLPCLSPLQNLNFPFFPFPIIEFPPTATIFRPESPAVAREGLPTTTTSLLDTKKPCCWSEEPTASLLPLAAASRQLIDRVDMELSNCNGSHYTNPNPNQDSWNFFLG